MPKSSEASTTSTARRLSSASIKSDISNTQVDKRINCFFTSTRELNFHFSLCVYLSGGFLEYLPHGQDCGKDAGLSEVDEYGSKYKYKCPFENCERGKPKARLFGYKELSIHCGAMHGVLERWAKDSDEEEAKELYELLKSQREEEGKALVEDNLQPVPIIREIAPKLKEINSSIASCNIL